MFRKKDIKSTGLGKKYPGKNYFYNSQFFCDFPVFLKSLKIMVTNIYIFSDVLFTAGRFARSQLILQQAFIVIKSIL